MKRITSILVVLLSMLLIFTGCSGNGGSGSGDVKGQIIYGSTTELNGDLGNAWWTNNASDNTVRNLIDDYDVITTDQGGEFVENASVVDSIESVVNADGTKTFTVKIKEGLKYNNGEAITAKDYVAYELVFLSPAASEAQAQNQAAAAQIVGGAEYNSGAAKEISGLRLLDDYTYAITIAADYIPYFYDISYASLKPIYLPQYASAALEVKDDGNGVYLDGGELVASEIDASRWIYEGRVSAGPYQLESLDLGGLTATLKVNPNYAGNFEGQKPHVETIIIVKAVQETMLDELQTGGIDFLSALTDGSEVQTALDLEETGDFKTVNYERNGYGFINFHCDFGPTQFKEVRHALAYLLDRNEFANQFCQGFGSVVDGPYGLSMWMYKEGKNELANRLNSYSYSLEDAVAELKAGGWTLNADGSEYVDGSGLVRYKEVTEEEAANYDGCVEVNGKKLMPLHIDWAASDGNSVSELIAVMLANGDATKEAGVEITQHVMDFSELLNYYYRDATQGEKYGVPTYQMFNLATNFTAVYDLSYNFTLDPAYRALGYNTQFTLDEELDQLSMDMVYGVESGDNAKFLEIWLNFVDAWNEYLPQIPLYSNVYYDVMNAKISNCECSSLFDFYKAVVYATVDE